MPSPLNILVFHMDGHGHLLASVGLAQSLAARGHRITYLLNEAYKGEVARFGFEEFLLKKSSAKLATDMMAEEEEEELDEENEELEEEEDNYEGGDGHHRQNNQNNNNSYHRQNSNPALQRLARSRQATGIFSAKSPLEKLRSQNSAALLLKEMYDALVDYHPQMGYAINRLAPQLIILDHYLVPPAILMSGLPWVYLFSVNPLGLHSSPTLPPFGSGYPTTGNPATWRPYRTLLTAKHSKVLAQYQRKLFDRFYYRPTAAENTQQGLFFSSEHLNVYGYPEELDYEVNAPLPANYLRVDTFGYRSPELFKLPVDLLQEGDRKLIYLSLGSMQVDVELMRRLTSILGRSPHRYIVSKGPRAAEYDLPANCFGAAFLPQSEVLPLVDLVISHGGNNTTTEALAAGKPLIVMPFFGDQYDNAQRVEEKGFGVRLEPYSIEEGGQQQLLATIDRLLADEPLKKRCQAAAARIEAANSKAVAVQRMEAIVQRHLQQQLQRF